MSGALVLLVPLLAVAAITVTVLVAVPRRRALAAVDRAAFPGLARLQRTTVVLRLLAVLLGVAVSVPVAASGRLGRGLMLVPAVFAAVQLLGVLAGDVVTRQDARAPGSAGLEVRRVRDLLPSGLTRLTALTAAALTGLLGWTTAVASADDLGRAGRALTYACTEDCTRAGLGPWPGSFYAVPMALALLIVALLGGLALAAAVRRPRNGADPEVVRIDDEVRRRSVESVVAGLGIAVSASTAGVGVLVGLGLADEPHAPLSLQVAGWVALSVGLLALALLVWCLVVLVLPGGRAGSRSHAVPVTGPPGLAGAGAGHGDPGRLRPGR